MYNWAKIIECKGIQTVVTMETNEEHEVQDPYFLKIEAKTEAMSGDVKFFFRTEEKMKSAFQSEGLNEIVESVVKCMA